MPRSFISPRFKKILLVALLLPAVGALAFTLFLTYSVSYGRSVPPARPNTIKVACVGDSITYGGLTENERYPHLLEQLLGSAYSVRNFGAIEHTVQKAGHLPYWDHRYFRLSSEFAPDVVIIMLGTNDAHPKNWAGAARFSADYRALIEHYQSLPSRPQLFLATPPSTYVEHKGNSIPDAGTVSEISGIEKDIGASLSIPVIDIHAATADHPELFKADGIHPDRAGDRLIAQLMYDALRADGKIQPVAQP